MTNGKDQLSPQTVRLNQRKSYKLGKLRRLRTALTVCHIGNDKRRYESQKNDKELKKSRSATNVSLVLLLDRVRMHYIHHHVENYS